MESKMPGALCGDVDDASDSVRGRYRNPQRFTFGPWLISTTRSHIMPSADMERLAEELGLPALPEMTFGDNVLSLVHAGGFGVEFTARGALRHVLTSRQHVQVACAEAWRSSRSEAEMCPDVVKPFDWTFTTDYRGTLTGDTHTLQVVSTDERVDSARLRARERILFFDEVLLYEDELHDHGTAVLSVKVRVMPSFLFLLLRYFLRVDGVLLRSNETRLYHQTGTDYLLREYSSRENLVSELQTQRRSVSCWR
ncbi:TIP41-like protein isoform X3 [Petromyzon marinus]|uniref:TIP41-like protein isoform X3 n=1 Tax=Petromyzon marinus TaxID=7757 RepID=UPI003F706718